MDIEVNMIHYVKFLLLTLMKKKDFLKKFL